MRNLRPLLLKLFFILFTFMVMISSFNLLNNPFRAVSSPEGLLDLSGYQWEEQGKLCLNGEWQFYYNKFIEPVKFSEVNSEVTPQLYIKPPKVWNESKIDGKSIPGFGYASYRLVVTGTTPGIPMALKVLPQSTAFRVYIDDRLVAENGKVSKQKSNSFAAYHDESILFTPIRPDFVITFHISNYEYARGGMWDAPTLGTEKQIAELDRFLLERDLFLHGCYCSMFLLCMVIYIYRPAKRSWLYLALLCVISFERVSLYGAHLISQFTEDFRLITFIEYVTRYWYPVLILFLINSVLSGKLSKNMLRGLVIFVLAVTAATAILPIWVYTSFAKAVIFFDLTVGIATCIFLLSPKQIFFKETTNKAFFLYGILALYVAAIYDMFFASTAYFEMTPVGFLIALLAFSFVLAIDYSEALEGSEDALHKLQIESERKLQTELQMLQSQIKPHFLYNALSAIANICSKDGKKAEQVILDLAYFMQASFDFNSSDRMITLESELELTRRYVHIEETRFGDKIKYTEQIQAPLSVQLPRLVLEPLVENAIRHGISKKKGGGEVCLKVMEVPQGISIEVYDNGIGMSKEKCETILEEQGQGIGLKNIHNRLIRLGEAGLKIESVEKEYTRVSFVMKKEG